MPLTELSALSGSLILFASWYLISARIRNAETPPSRQIVFLRAFYFYIAVFFLLMFLPHLWLNFDSSKFPLYMALGYTIGHVFYYISLLYLSRVLFSLVPSLASREKIAIVLSAVIGTIITVLTTATMVFGKRPAYDYAHHVTLVNANPAVGASIAIFSFIIVAPTAFLMILNGIHNPTARVRSFLLGGGLFVLLTGGPIHDTARTGTIYAAADILTITGVLIMTSGLLYRFEERLVPNRRPLGAAAAHPLPLH
ncbi:MAG TPA: hypothetical protein VGM08_00750 [Candidatus Saccharimonadales bacterium]|jgi:hypothetical protein